MCILLASVSHSLPFSVSSQISENRGKGMTECGSERHCLMVAAPSYCSIYPSVLMSQQPGNSSIPLGLVPTCLLTPTISQSWTRSASEKSMWERWLADQKSGPKLSVLSERRSLVNHQPRTLSSSSTELPAWHGGSSSQVSGGASQPLAYRILQTGAKF